MKPFKFFSKNGPHNWKTSDGRIIEIENLGVRHINNIMNCLLGIGRREIPDPYYGRSKEEWYSIFTRELRRRNLT